MSRSGAAAILERGSQAVMRQRLFSGRWLTVMSGDDLRKRMGAVKVGRGSSKGGRERPPKESAERRRVFVIRRVIVERRSPSSSERDVERHRSSSRRNVSTISRARGL